MVQRLPVCKEDSIPVFIWVSFGCSSCFPFFQQDTHLFDIRTKKIKPSSRNHSSILCDLKGYQYIKKIAFLFLVGYDSVAHLAFLFSSRIPICLTLEQKKIKPSSQNHGSILCDLKKIAFLFLVGYVSVAHLAFLSSSRIPICMILEQKKSNRAAETSFDIV